MDPVYSFIESINKSQPWHSKRYDLSFKLLTSQLEMTDFSEILVIGDYSR